MDIWVSRHVLLCDAINHYLSALSLFVIRERERGRGEEVINHYFSALCPFVIRESRGIMREGERRGKMQMDG